MINLNVTKTQAGCASAGATGAQLRRVSGGGAGNFLSERLQFEIEKGLPLWLKRGATQLFTPSTKGHRT
ncbi:MAG: hypothetical protein ACREM3_30570, partial [Candidatus Rokuibacteriota bacterium]